MRLPRSHPTGDRIPNDGALLALDYEVHPTPGDPEPARPSPRRSWRSYGLTALSIRHASGPVAIGETSVEIVAIAGHRDAAFRGCRDAIDRLKRETPIWKQRALDRRRDLVRRRHPDPVASPA